MVVVVVAVCPVVGVVAQVVVVVVALRCACPLVGVVPSLVVGVVHDVRRVMV